MQLDLLNLPFAIQMAVGSGYLAYLVAYAGIREHHSTTDVVFRTLSFGIVTTGILTLPIKYPYLLAALAITATVFAGIVWRKFGMRWSKSLLRSADVSWSDDIPSAWMSLTAADTDCPHAQISVELDDGRMLHCANTRNFADAPYGPCLYGPDGSIAMYVTKEMRPDGSWFEHEHVFDESEGWQITYIRPSIIRKVHIRLRGRMPNVPDETISTEAKSNESK